MGEKDSVTPMMRQYQEIKAQHPDEVLFFRLGDFYEMFDEDAIEVSRLLNLTLTHRGSAPMCGIPYHAATSYLKRLLDAGKKVAVCEQLTLPESSRELARREVIQVYTPGTVVDDEYLDSFNDNFVFCVDVVKGQCVWRPFKRDVPGKGSWQGPDILISCFTHEYSVDCRAAGLGRPVLHGQKAQGGPRFTGADRHQASFMELLAQGGENPDCEGPQSREPVTFRA